MPTVNVEPIQLPTHIFKIPHYMDDPLPLVLDWDDNVDLRFPFPLVVLHTA